MTDIRIPLSRERILEAAVTIANAEGVDGLTMRKLATSLGFEAMSLYNHVENKHDLLQGMVDWIAGEMDRRDAGRPWKEAVRAMSLSAHEVLLEHGWATQLWSEMVPGRNRVLLMEDLLAAFREGGFDARLAHFGFHAVTMHIVGFTLQQLSYPINADTVDDAAAGFLDTLEAGRFPYLVEHVEYHVHGDEGGDFEFILDLILDGLERAAERDGSS